MRAAGHLGWSAVLFESILAAAPPVPKFREQPVPTCSPSPGNPPKETKRQLTLKK